MFSATSETPTTLNFRDCASEDHRRFHDRIVAELNGILPICNQGKCTAADISDSPTEQQQITDLMEKVEQLCSQLSENVTDLFSQFYQERGRFCGAAYCTTAEIKVNLVDRTLMDRSTDVRWWSKEPCLANAVTTFRDIRKSLVSDIQEMEAYLEGSIAAFRIPKLSGDWKSMDIADRVQEVTRYFSRTEELMFSAEVREAFVAAMQGLIELLAEGENQEAAIKFARRLIKKLGRCEASVRDACQQLETIKRTYPSLQDIFVTDATGTVIATACPRRRANSMSTSVADQAWCRKALAPKNNNTYIERVQDVEGRTPAIVFSSGIRDPQDRQAAPIGTIGVFCNFQQEVQGLLNDYLPSNENGEPRDGWFSFFTDQHGVVICANDPDAIPPGFHSGIPRSHRQVSNGGKRWSNLVFNGQPSFLFSACSTKQHTQNERGWVSHVIAPSADIMQADAGTPQLSLEDDHLLNSKLVPEISKSIYAALQDDRKAIKLISLNGILFASQLGKRGAALAPVFDKITATGDSATSRMESLLYELANAEIELNVRLQETLAKQAVDLFMQKVGERAQALKLWSRNATLQSALSDLSAESIAEVEPLLRSINDDYPFYRNLFLVDINGEIRACSRPGRIAEVPVRCLADQPAFAVAIRDDAETGPCVMETRRLAVDPGNDTSIVFTQGISGPQGDAATVGAIVCLFDWRTVLIDIVQTCLPKAASGRPVPGSLALFTDRDQVVLESTNHALFAPGGPFPLPDKHLQLPPGQSICSQFRYQDQVYVMASAKCETVGERPAVDWTSHVLRPID